MVEIVNVKDYTGGIEEAARYIHSKWGSETNYPFYYDAILHSSEPGKPLPQFFLMLKDGEIIGCYGLIVNDFISRHDLYPWFAALFIEEKERKQGYGGLLLDHGLREASSAGFKSLYLTTDHDGYYERYGWQRIEDGYDPRGEKTRIYQKAISDD